MEMMPKCGRFLTAVFSAKSYHLRNNVLVITESTFKNVEILNLFSYAIFYLY